MNTLIKKICKEIQVKLNREMGLYEALKIEVLYEDMGHPVSKVFVRNYVAMDKASHFPTSTPDTRALLSVIESLNHQLSKSKNQATELKKELAELKENGR